MKSQCFAFLIVVLITISCNTVSTVNDHEVNFPLERSSTLSVDERIEKLAITSGWAVVQVPGKLKAIDTNTGQQQWAINNFSADTDSMFQIVDDLLPVVNYKTIRVVNRSGKQKEITLMPERGDINRLVAATAGYLYLIRDPLWTLQAYDIAKNKLVWETPAGRGQTDVFYDQASGITYAVTPHSIKAIENANGKIIWQQQANIKHSSFADGILYLCEQVGNTSTYKFTALDTLTRKELWNQKYSLNSGEELYHLSIIGDLAIVTTRYGYLALSKENGAQKWHSETVNDIFYNVPVEYNKILYAKGSSDKLYAISLDDGSIIGYILLENNPVSKSRYDVSQGVYQIEDGIATTTNNEIILFRQK